MPRIAAAPSMFKYPSKTTIPTVLGPAWEDRSWSNDASACCWLNVPSKKTPKAVLCLWVQADDKAVWELPEQGKYQLDFMPDHDEGWDNNTGKTLLTTDDIKAVVARIKTFRAEGALS